MRIDPKKTAALLCLITGSMVLLHLIACIPFFFMDRSYPFGPLNMDGERNIPTLFSTALLWLCSLIAACIARAEKEGGWRRMLPWWGLALVFLGLGVDESMQLHERLTEPLHLAWNTRGGLRFAWVIPYAALALLFAAVYARFFFRLPGDTRKYIFAAAVLYVGGSIGMEMFGAFWMEQNGRAGLYYLLVMAEETMEMCGCVCFIYAFLNHIDRHLPAFSIRITGS